MKTWAVVLTAFATAMCTLLSSEPFGSGLAAIAAPALLIFIACHATSTKQAVFWIFLFQVPLWLVLHSWVEVVAFAGWIGLSVYMSIWAPLFMLLLSRVQAKNSISIVITAPTIWVGLECLRGIIIFDGYPWYLAGTGIVDWPIVSIASVGSVWSASFLVVAIAGALVTANRVGWWTWSSLGVVCSFFLYQGLAIDKHTGARFDVAVIQTNVPQSNKVAWDWESQLDDVSNAIAMTFKSVEEGIEKPSLIIWPETMLPGSGFEVRPTDFAPWEDYFVPYWAWPKKIREITKELGIPMLVGSQTHLLTEIIDDGETLSPEFSSIYNSAVLVRPDGITERYDKVFLTPFGERIPYVHLFPFVQDWIRDNFGASMLFDLDYGGHPNRFTLQCNGVQEIGIEEITFATPICFEDTVPRVVRELIWEDGNRRAGALINLSNDGWFSSDDSARLQHIREARMRCIENRTPMVRAANTGLSCFIDDRGKIRDVAVDSDGRLALQQSAILHTRVFEGIGLPLSRFIGDWVAWLSLIGGILLVMCASFKRSKENDTTDEDSIT